jgi:hypothetical protein
MKGEIKYGKALRTKHPKGFSAIANHFKLLPFSPAFF